MNWKIFTAAFISVLFVSFPENGITCGATEDPHDYFTSFFSRSVGNSTAYRPFYYSALLKFYDDADWEVDSTHLYDHDKIIEEWKQYTSTPSTADAVQVIYKSDEEDLKKLLSVVQNNNGLPKAFLKNQFAQHLLKEKKTDAVAYLQFAKKIEGVTNFSAWDENKKNDSAQLNKYIAEANAQLSKTNDAFLKNKYAFQRCKVAFYNNRSADCIKWYDEYFTPSNNSVVNQLALAYKAGSLFRLKRNKESAYYFSKAFALSDHNKRQNFLGFLWATDFCDPKYENEYTAFCKTSQEKANMKGMFSMFGVSYKLREMQDIYEMDASSPLLPLVAVREINKLEEQYFTPLLSKEKGGKALYVTWDFEDEKTKRNQKDQLLKTITFFEKLFTDQNVNHRALYAAGAAYLHFINKNYTEANRLISAAKSIKKDDKINDQLQLINLLVLANERKTLDATHEAEILPSIKWLAGKADRDVEYRLFARNFFSEILAQKYEQQGDSYRAALAYGLADLGFLKPIDDYYYSSYPTAIEYLHNEMNSEQLLKLFNLMSASTVTEAEKYFITHASFKRDDVIDVLGTSFLRDRNYTKAIEWFRKASRVDTLATSVYNYKTDKEKFVNYDPFFDYLNDWQRYDKTLPKAYTKLSLAEKLLDMEKKIPVTKSAEEKSKLYYQLASALYNMSYYGNSWSVLAYDRSGSDWNHGNYKLPWEKEYYGVYKAGEYYQKAYELTGNKEFKAACLFMVAKCTQRQVVMPGYDYNNYDLYENNMTAFEKKFMDNPLFSKFKSEFGSTKYYQYVYNRCSYLRDFIVRNRSKK